MNITYEAAVQRELAVLSRIGKVKYELSCLVGSCTNPDNQDTFIMNCKQALEKVDVMELLIADNLAYLYTAHENESRGDSNDI